MPDIMEAPVKRKRGRPKKSEVPATITADPLDKKLDHFATTTNQRDMEWWEGDQTLSPLHVPKEIKDNPKYTGRRWHWVSETRQKRYGKEYHGWQLFKDSDNPDGLRRGNDLTLAWMPEDKARRYNEFVSKSSTERVRSQQENVVNKVGHSTEDMQVEGGLIIGARPMSGMLVNGKFIPSGNRGHRGYNPDEIKEMTAKVQESRAKGRKYFT